MKKETSDKKDAAKLKEQENKMAMRKLIEYAKPERKMLIVSCIFSMCNGVIPPLLTMFFSEML